MWDQKEDTSEGTWLGLRTSRKPWKQVYHTQGSPINTFKNRSEFKHRPTACMFRRSVCCYVRSHSCDSLLASASNCKITGAYVAFEYPTRFYYDTFSFTTLKALCQVCRSRWSERSGRTPNFTIRSSTHVINIASLVIHIHVINIASLVIHFPFPLHITKYCTSWPRK